MKSPVKAIGAMSCYRGCHLHIQSHADTIWKLRHQDEKLSQINSFASCRGADEPSCKEPSWAAGRLALMEHTIPEAVFFQYRTCVKRTELFGLFLILYLFKTASFVSSSSIYSASRKSFPVFSPFSSSESSLLCSSRVTKEFWKWLNVPAALCWQCSAEN